MAYQSSGNVLAALKREVTYGTEAAGGAGGFALPVIDSPGMKLSRGEINSGRRRRNQIRKKGRLGSRTGAGTYNTELLPGGAIDLLIESLARGTYGALASYPTISTTTQLRRVVPPPQAIYHSYTVEQQDRDIDRGELFRGGRLTSGAFSFRPNSMSTVAWGFQAIARRILTEAQSPYYVDPTELTGESLVADDSTILYKGSPIVTFTSLDVTFNIASALQPTIGSDGVSPDVFMNDLSITASLAAIRENLDALTDYDAETEFDIQVVLTEPGTGAVPTIALVLKNAKIMDIDAPFLGGEAGKIETRSLQVDDFEFYTSTETPTAVV